MTNKSLPGDLVVWNNHPSLALIIARHAADDDHALEEIIILEPSCMVERWTFRKGAVLTEHWWTLVARNSIP